MDITKIIELVNLFMRLFCPEASEQQIVQALKSPSYLQVRQAAIIMAKENGDRVIRWRRYVDEVTRELGELSDEDCQKIAAAAIDQSFESV